MNSIFYTIGLLIVSNIFMTLAWYGHLKHKSSALWLVILTSWGLAFFEYVFQVPANRIGSEAGLTVTHLKIIQECITLTVLPLSLILCLAKLSNGIISFRFYF